MDKLGMHIKHFKRRGEWAELRFLTRASEYGLCVSKPWGDTSHYDFIVEDQHSRLLRVQVKSTGSRKHHGYAIQARGSQGAYPASAYDFLAAYVIPDDIWFIIPEELIRGSTTIIVAINGRKYSPYLEAWKLLMGAAGSDTSTEIVIEVP